MNLAFIVSGTDKEWDYFESPSEIYATSDGFGCGVTSGWEADKRIRGALSANPFREAIRWSSFGEDTLGGF